MPNARIDIRPIPSSSHGRLRSPLPQDECIPSVETHVHRGEIRAGSVPSAYALEGGYRPLRMNVRKVAGIQLDLEALEVWEMRKMR